MLNHKRILELEPVIEGLDRTQVNWYGLVSGLSEERILTKVLEANRMGKKQRMVTCILIETINKVWKEKRK